MIFSFLFKKGAYYLVVLKEWLLRYCITQLCITAVSLPFFVSWGLEFSLASFIGNLIFSPFITIFLLLSSLIFVCSIFGYTPWLLITALNQLNIVWIWLLRLGSASWMITVPFSSTFILFCYAFFLIYLGMTRSWKTRLAEPKKLIYYTLIFCISFSGLQYTFHQNKPTYFQQKLYISPDKNNNLSLYDNGFFCTPGNSINKVAYDLKPFLNKNYKKKSIKTYVSNKLSIKTCQGLSALLSATTIKEIILPPLEKGLSKSFWFTYFSLKEKAEKEGTKLYHSKNTQKILSKYFGSLSCQKTSSIAAKKGNFSEKSDSL